MEKFYLINEQYPLLAGGVRHRLLNDIRRELVLRQFHHCTANHSDYFGLALRLAVLQHVLDDVVAVLVLEQGLGVLVELLEDVRRLFGRTVLQDALDHPAAVRVGRQVRYLALKAGSMKIIECWVFRFDSKKFEMFKFVEFSVQDWM